MTDNQLMELATTWEQSGHIYTVKRGQRWYLKVLILHHFREAELAYAFRRAYGGHVSIRQDGQRVWSLTSQHDQRQFLEIMRDQIPDGVAGPLTDRALEFLRTPPELREELAQIVRVTNLHTTEIRKIHGRRHRKEMGK